MGIGIWYVVVVVLPFVAFAALLLCVCPCVFYFSVRIPDVEISQDV
jgi:hypothetical protein